MKKNNINSLKTITRLFAVPLAMILSVGLSSCDSTKEIAEDSDPSVEVSETAVTNPDTTKNTP